MISNSAINVLYIRLFPDLKYIVKTPMIINIIPITNDKGFKNVNLILDSSVSSKSEFNSSIRLLRFKTLIDGSLILSIS